MRRKYDIQNTGGNQGIIVGENSGNITLSLDLKGVVKLPSSISQIVQVLGELCYGEKEEEDSRLDFQQYKMNEKLEYNSVVEYKPIIEEFSSYYYMCDNYLNIYDDSNIRGKTKILRWVHMSYLRAKGKVLSENRGTGEKEIDIIRRNSDRIIHIVSDKIYDIVVNSKGIEKIDIEDIELGIACFTCYCFMECKILEKPI